MKVNWLYDATLNAKTPILVHSGGSSSSKTYSTVQALFTIASTQPNKVITIVGSDLPNLKKGAIRDAKTVVDAEPFFQQQIEKFNKSDHVYFFKTGSVIEFTSYADSQDAKAGKRTHCFLNEANGIPYPIFEQLRIRTTELTVLDFNPSAEFWAHTVLKGRKDVTWIDSTFRDNAFVHPTVKKAIMGYEPTPENIQAGTANEYRWKVYGLGQLSRLEGLIFPQFNVTASWPMDYNIKWHGYGLDFGYTNDPTALIEVKLYRGELYARQLIYQRGLTNPDIAEKMQELGVDKSIYVIADSAEPKSIAEIGQYGFLIKEVVKGRDSIMHGIDLMKRYKINVHNESKDLIKEFNSYTWKVDRDGKALNVPIDKFNHGIDAFRYSILDRFVEPKNDNYEALTEFIVEESVFI